MARFSTQIFAFVLTLTGSFQNARGYAYIEIKFLSYSANCKEKAGLNKCDPQFTFCLDRPRNTQSTYPCAYGIVGESSHFQDTNYIDFSTRTSIGGIANPWLLRTELRDPSILLAVRVRDDDIFDDHHLHTWAQTFTETVYPSKSETKWTERQMSSGHYKIVFKIQIYCDANYYSSNCNKYCKAEDQPSGHYTCEKGTGRKICMPGWGGETCNKDIDECALGFCERGICENLPGAYICHCPAQYTEKNCTAMIHPCDSNPCKHGATCLPSSDLLSYTCNCTVGWEGRNCDVLEDPCKSSPCMNGATCIWNSNDTNYSCSCVYPYTGAICKTTFADTDTRSITSSAAGGETTALSNPDIGTTEQSSTTDGSAVKGVPKSDYNTMHNDDSGFQFWHGIIIAIAVLLVTVILVICLVVARHRRQHKKLPEGLPAANSPVVFSHGDNLVFENGLYSGFIRIESHENGGLRQQLPLPSTPTEDDQFNPIKPMFCPDVEAQGAEGGYTDMDADGYVKPSSLFKAVPDAERKDKAMDNPYSDFGTLKERPVRCVSVEEPHYQDLDETVMAVRRLDEMSRKNKNSVQASPFNVNMYSNSTDRENPYPDTPTNIPVLPVHSSPKYGEKNFSSTSVMGDEFGDNSLCSSEKLGEDVAQEVYTQTAPKSDIQSKTFHEGPYADASIITCAPSNKFSNQVVADDDDDMADYGLPSTSASTEGGYDTPKSSYPKTPKKVDCFLLPLDTQENQYDRPSSNQPSNSQYDLLSTSGSPSPVYSKFPEIAEEHPRCDNSDPDVDVELNGKDRTPLPSTPKIFTELNGTYNIPRSISIHEGFTFINHNDDLYETGDN